MITFFSCGFFLTFAFFQNLVTVGVNSQMKIFPHLYFDGDAPNVQDTIKDNFYQLLMSPYVLPLFCKDSPDLCLKNDMSVSLGVKGKC